MARPPIVISNGGIADALAEGLIPGDDKSAQTPSAAALIILANVNGLNGRGPTDNPPVAKSLSGSNKKSEPRIYWRLEDEAPYSPGQGSSAKELGLEAQ